MKLFLKVILVIFIVLTVYLLMNNSKEAVQNMSIKNLIHTVYSVSGNHAKQKQQEESLDYALSKMAQQGWNIDKALIDALEDNPYIKETQFNLFENNMRGLDKVEVITTLSDNKLDIPIKMFFFVQPKSKFTISSFSEIPHSAKLLPMIAVELAFNGRSKKFTDSQVADILPVLYNEEASKSLLIKFQKR